MTTYAELRPAIEKMRAEEGELAVTQLVNGAIFSDYDTWRDCADLVSACDMGMSDAFEILAAIGRLMGEDDGTLD